jgi:hypothetical protein
MDGRRKFIGVARDSCQIICRHGVRGKTRGLPNLSAGEPTTQLAVRLCGLKNDAGIDQAGTPNIVRDQLSVRRGGSKASKKSMAL